MSASPSAHAHLAALPAPVRAASFRPGAAASVPAVLRPVRAGGLRLASLLLVLAAALGAAQQVSAAGTGASPASPMIEARDGQPPSRARDYPADMLRPQALRECLLQAHRLDEDYRQLADSLAVLNREREVLAAELGGLRAESANARSQPVATRSGDARASRLERLAAYKSREEAFNLRVDAHTAAVDERAVRAAAFSSHCGGRKYYRADLDALRPELPPEVTARYR